MKKLIPKLLSLAWLASWAIAAPVAGQLRVVATTPDLGALAKEIGGDRVDITALAKPTEDPHFVDARPSLIVTLNRADMLIEGGAELEIGWLPALLQGVRNTKIAAGAPGRVSAASGVAMLDVPASLDRSRGDVHALGNPHFMLDPVNVRLIAAEIANHLAQVDAASAEQYRSNLQRFNERLDAKLTEWQAQLAPFRGAKIVTYHRDFVYLAARFNLEVATTLEERPGIAPSPAHVAQVISTMREQNARVILVQPYQNRRTAETVARQTDAVVLDMPQQPGVAQNTDSYFTLMDYLVHTLAGALGQGR
ncbi:MAG: zinc ABC transporter substrate-binding protein [Gemmatimonadetes bacterium]|nr:zinc ABC transporter substrate-binding protein [Gemmatimonadota bacterium]